MWNIAVMSGCSFAVTIMFLIQYFALISVHILLSFSGIPEESCGNDQ